jgi:uncharacterized protein
MVRHGTMSSATLNPGAECPSAKWAEPKGFRPIAQSERNTTIDVLRGVALCGVLWVNLLTEFRVSLFQHLLVFHTHTGFLNEWIDLVTTWLVEFKAFTVLSFLFGVGIAIQAERAGEKGMRVSRFLLRRDSMLLLVGLCHMFLVWDGDILCLYAVCGLLAVPLIRLPPKALLLLGIALIAMTFTSVAGSFIPSEAAMRAQADASTPIYAHGTWHAILALRSREIAHFMVPLLIDSLPKTLGLSLLGVAAWRHGIFKQTRAHRSLLAVVFVGATLIGGLMTSLIFWAAIANRGLPWPSPISDGFSYIPLGLGLAAGMTLWLSYTCRGRVIEFLAAFGQMALTNYLFQSVIFGFIFYGYGLQWFGKLSPSGAAVIGIAVLVVQISVSHLWLLRFRFGPFEWLWRSMTYGQRQPMRHR